MKLAPVPVSKAKTAFGLLGEIENLILDEPKRYNQGDTISLYSQHDLQWAYSAPACGAVGCVGGWVVLMKLGRRRIQSLQKGVLDVARDILGLDFTQAEQLFATFAAKGSAQTPAHARSGAAHVRRFRKKYENQLRRTRV